MKILIIADPARLDYFDFITSADSSIKKWELIWDYKYSERSEKKDLLTLANDKPISIHYWSDFFTPYELIRKINPDKIVFFEIIDLWQIPLVIAARKKGVSTFFIEHGVGNSVEQDLIIVNQKNNSENNNIQHAQMVFIVTPNRRKHYDDHTYILIGKGVYD